MGFFLWGGGGGVNGGKKVIVQNCGRVLMKPRYQPGEVVLAS